MNSASQVTCIFCLTLLSLQVRDFLGEQMSLRGIEFHTEESPQAILKSPDGSLSLKTNKGTVGGFSHIMFATGRRPNTKVVSSTYLPPSFSALIMLQPYRLTQRV